MGPEQKLDRIALIVAEAEAIVGNYVNSRLALEAIQAVLDDEPDKWDEYRL